MCFHPMKVKVRNIPYSKEKDPRAFSSTFVPCGKCEECRRSKQMSWTWRLQAEFESLRKRTDCEWHFGFLTLTYGTEKGGYKCDMCPVIPKELFLDESRYKPVRCFNRAHCADFIKALRKALHKKYWIGRKKAPKRVRSSQKDFKFIPDTNIRYCLAAEHGGYNGRPHYHLVLSWPVINGLTDLRVYELCRRFWAPKHGFMFPKYFNGGDNNGREEKPFVIAIGDLSKSLRYVSKYICKDMEFNRRLHDVPVDRKKKAFRNFDCFHLQSRSLGLSIIKNMQDNEKLDLLLKGYFFKDEPQRGMQSIPSYIRDKIVFDLNYIYEPAKVPVTYTDYYDEEGVFHSRYTVIVDGYKRLVRKEANKFFRDNYLQVFAKQKKFYTKLFTSMCEKNFWIEKKVTEDRAESFTKLCRNILKFAPVGTLADWYIGFYKRLPGSLVNVSPALAFLSRYDVDTYNKVCYNEPLEPAYCSHMDDLVHCYLATLRYVLVEKSDEEIHFDEISHVLKEGVLNEI